MRDVSLEIVGLFSAVATSIVVPAGLVLTLLLSPIVFTSSVAVLESVRETEGSTVFTVPLNASMLDEVKIVTETTV